MSIWGVRYSAEGRCHRETRRLDRETKFNGIKVSLIWEAIFNFGPIVYSWVNAIFIWNRSLCYTYKT